ncbi:MAG: hypothetical protein ACRDO1_17970 [Nocardioidaceae bacterium]
MNGVRPGPVVAAACLALLSLLRFSDGSTLLAVVFAVLALVALGLALRPDRRAGEVPAEPPSTPELRSARAAHDAHRRGWRNIALLGFAVSGVSVFVFPPLALVVAGLTLYSVRRMRQSSRSAQILGGYAG